jgi:hypothetical protein
VRVGHGGLSFQVEINLGESLIRYVESPLGCATLLPVSSTFDPVYLAQNTKVENTKVSLIL